MSSILSMLWAYHSSLLRVGWNKMTSSTGLSELLCPMAWWRALDTLSRLSLPPWVKQSNGRCVLEGLGLVVESGNKENKQNKTNPVTVWSLPFVSTYYSDKNGFEDGRKSIHLLGEAVRWRSHQWFSCKVYATCHSQLQLIDEVLRHDSIVPSHNWDAFLHLFYYPKIDMQILIGFLHFFP